MILLILVSAAVARQCNCNNGNVDIAEPQCSCSCYSGYLMPRCLYTASDMVTVEIWVKKQPQDFFSNDLVNALSWALPVKSSADISFLYAQPHAAVNKTAAFVSLRGDRAQQLVWDVYSSNGWLAKASIEAAWEHIPDLPSNTNYGATLSVYRSTDGKVLITVEGILWLIAAVVMVVALSLLECCFLWNTEDNVEETLIAQMPELTDLHDKGADGGFAGHAVAAEHDDDGGQRGSGPNPLQAPHRAPLPSKEYVEDPRSMTLTDRARR